MRKIIYGVFLLFLLSPLIFGQKSEVEKLLEEGKRAYAEGRYSEAISKLNLAVSLIKSKRQLVEAYTNLALTYFTIGDEANARENLKKAFSVNPKLVFDPDYYSPKFISLAEEVRREFIVEVKLQSNVVARFEVDGQMVGEGKLIPISLPKGRHRFLVKAEGYGSVERELDVEKNGAVLKFELKPMVPRPPKGVKVAAGKKGGSKLLYYIGGAALGAGAAAIILTRKSGPKTATLRITTEPPGAKIQVDGVDKGSSPLNVDVAPGTHRIRASIELYGEARTEVNVKEGQTYDVNLTLSPYKYEFVKCFSGFQNPLSIDVDENGKIYITDFWTGVVFKIDERGEKLAKSKPFKYPNLPIGLAYSSYSDSVFVSAYQGGFYKFTPNLTISWVKPIPFKSSISVEADDEGNVYVADSGGNTILKFNQEGDEIKSWNLHNPYFMAYLKNTLYVTYLNTSNKLKVRRFSTSGQSKGDLPLPGGLTPMGIDSDGVSLYIVDFYGEGIVKVSPEGKEIISFGYNNAYKIDIAADPTTGDVWVTTGDNGKVCHWRMTNKTVSSGRVSVKSSGMIWKGSGGFRRRGGNSISSPLNIHREIRRRRRK